LAEAGAGLAQQGLVLRQGQRGVRVGADDEIEVGGEVVLFEAEGLAEQALEGVTVHGVAAAAAYGQAQTRVAQ